MMVSPYDDARLLLVLQIDHSRVAGRLAGHVGNDGFATPRPYASTVLAAQEHDNGWWDWEIMPTLSERGYPLDYIGSLDKIDQEEGRVQRWGGLDDWTWLDFQHACRRYASHWFRFFKVPAACLSQ